MKNRNFRVMQTKFGPLYLVATDKGLCGVYWRKPLLVNAQSPNTEFQNQNPSSAIEKIIDKAQIQLSEYLTGARNDFDLPLDFDGTPFQNTVWKALQMIPYGKTISYATLAKKIKNDKAVRAVGSANGKNPLGIVVPCHRVIASDGSLGGYSGGLDKKLKLLEIEKVTI